MGPWTYYSPLATGMAVMLALLETLRSKAPAMPAWALYAYLGVLVVAGGLVAQLLLIGMQGARAQVLPVPFGKSIRGRAAVGAGYLILVCALLAVIAFLLGGESLTTAAWALTILSAGCGIGALLIYVWSLPVAIVDFRDERL